MEPYESLANAIILQATQDYRTALKILRQHPDSRGAQAIKDDCEGFFRSSWFGVLTTIEPEYLIKRLNAEVDGI